MVDINQIVKSDKYRHSDKVLNKDDDIIKPLCIALPQMSEYMKYFDNGGKNMFNVIEDEGVLVK